MAGSRARDTVEALTPMALATSLSVISAMVSAFLGYWCRPVQLARECNHDGAIDCSSPLAGQSPPEVDRDIAHIGVAQPAGGHFAHDPMVGFSLGYGRAQFGGESQDESEVLGCQVD